MNSTHSELINKAKLKTPQKNAHQDTQTFVACKLQNIKLEAKSPKLHKKHRKKHSRGTQTPPINVQKKKSSWSTPRKKVFPKINRSFEGLPNNPSKLPLVGDIVIKGDKRSLYTITDVSIGFHKRTNIEKELQCFYDFFNKNSAGAADFNNLVIIVAEPEYDPPSPESESWRQDFQDATYPYCQIKQSIDSTVSQEDNSREFSQGIIYPYRRGQSESHSSSSEDEDWHDALQDVPGTFWKMQPKLESSSSDNENWHDALQDLLDTCWKEQHESDSSSSGDENWSDALQEVRGTFSQMQSQSYYIPLEDVNS